MPKLPGREPTRVKVPFHEAWVASFNLTWERVNQSAKQCVILGCDHPLSAPCGKGKGVGSIVRDGDINTHLGYACECCMDAILPY